jgi:hypothetical protein
MLGNLFSVAIHLHGTLAANADGAFTLPGAATLIGVSIVGSNSNDAVLDVGDAGDSDGVIDGGACGDSGTPGYLDADDFNGALADAVNPYHYPSDDKVVHWTLDYDGSDGTAVADCEIVFWFLEG